MWESLWGSLLISPVFNPSQFKTAIFWLLLKATCSDILSRSYYDDYLDISFIGNVDFLLSTSILDHGA